ncbi:mannose-1-phosphate guanylyltransferase/mannose-6-phosphate isomerase [Dasania sp. GY-MA-18]|uniref:mannose-1-phosphate guanylyltransferase n=1 Tax=Dasania phycosphaerae TaxID=2950436 RepID=A0A9J6RNU8_9GAMM|nr:MULTISPECIES: mannose-1-phosphate guanylyltransferase/mannose-6-phosphate isomerase [Dasania]MCR8923746.1 mannose-1-phosphate guanylyltransferase/mannose-6-phosphate isomerase [Dasania sp. GY-MA-18]MCZ0866180.1 mannose-1-phosphate guanylyltransferase/mannose-6-phosphate isomerase [Dasania phycosphaerae]MCZ0869904.1 mannose-1-phosphate guanylyltransferase/mannose-6-phosphate isomerase [Dasania phycosphaerae]
MLIPVVMAGGSGTRLWPLSRALHPKQFLNLYGEHSMLQATIKRLSAIETTAPVTICNEEHRFIVAEQLRAINELGPIILEPEGRNTAPAIALAAEVSQQQHVDSDPLLLVLAADHIIENESAFISAIQKAIPLAEQGKMVTFGIVPNSAHTGYGYIKRGVETENCFSVDSFVEKPDQATAEQYVDSGNYYWNSGMFLFKASRYLQELNQHRPDIAQACTASLKNTAKDLDFIRIDSQAFLACPEDSIDYAVMEKTTEAVVLPLDAGWNDIGAWSALWEVGEKDSNDNVVKGDAILEESHNCLIQGGERLVTTIGLDNIVIVDTKDALLVAAKDKVQDVKNIVSKLKAQKRSEATIHRQVYRPWGMYDSVDAGHRHQVKRITVNPGAKLSVQMHHHRAEHWVVVSGTAKVTKGDKTFLVAENESTYIAIGEVHALENPGKVPLELIEVQSGSYLGEDDIVRLEDNYGRS